jgi:uncharacterized membrane protein
VRTAEVPTTRVEAFSDGVIAIAITLLVLDIKVPAVGEAGSLADALASRWPAYAAYVVSFLTVGVMWANHHTLMEHVRRADRGLLLVTVFFLMAVSFVPFPTAVLAEHLAGGHGAPARDRTTAALLFGGTYVATGLAFNALWAYARRRGLLHDADHPAVRAITARYRLGPWVYLGLTLLALASVPASVAGLAALAAYWAAAGLRAPGAA